MRTCTVVVHTYPAPSSLGFRRVRQDRQFTTRSG